MQASVTALVAPEASNERSPAVVGSYPQALQETNFFDLTSLRAILWRQRWILLLVTAAALIGGAVMTAMMTPVYQAAATVQIEPQGTEIIEGQGATETFVPTNEIFEYLETLKAVVTSRTMALRVADDLRLGENAAFMGEMATQPVPAGMSAQAWAESKRQAAASALQGGVGAEIVMNTRILELTFSSENAALAATIANAFADNFLTNNIDRSLEANADALEYLEREITQTREKLRQNEMAAISYARANRIIGQESQSEDGDDVGTSTTLTGSNLVDVSSQLNVARAKRIDAEQRWRTVASIAPSQLPEVRDNTTIQSLNTRAAELGARISELRLRYREDYPELVGLEAERASLERQSAALGAEVKRSIRDEYEIARRQEEALSRDLQTLSSQTLDEQDSRVQLNLLSREATATRVQLATLLERFNQISSAANMQSNSATLLDPARVPGAPYSPNIFTNMLLSLILGLGVAFALAVLREVFDDRLRSPEDLEAKLHIPALGQTPHISQDLSTELESMFSPISEAYSSIRATLDFALPKAGHYVIQFTSSQPAEGKTTSAIAIATKFASVGRRVLLIDMDLRRPAIVRTMELDKPQVGVVDVLHGRVALETALLKNETENLFILPTGQIPHNPVEILSSGLVPEFLAKHRRDFDVIIIDSSPVLGIADAPLLSRYVDAVVFVVEANRSHFGQVKVAVRRLRDMNANIIGALLTKFRAMEAGKSINYEYQYYEYKGS